MAPCPDSAAARPHDAVAGRVVRVRLRQDGGWRVRLAETGGALAAAEFRPFDSIPLPPVGAWIILRGPIRYDEQHSWYVVDPVEYWVQAYITIRFT
jgi:hypothetical protein